MFFGGGGKVHIHLSSDLSSLIKNNLALSTSKCASMFRTYDSMYMRENCHKF